MLAVDPLQERRDAAQGVPGVRAFDTLSKALEEDFEAAVICTPPGAHLDVAADLLGRCRRILIEKPLAHRADAARLFLSKASGHECEVTVGYNLRFERGLRHLKSLLDRQAVGRVLSIRAEFGQYLPDWRPDSDYREGYFARTDTGGGIILDGSHELDYVRWLGGEVSKVSCIARHSGALDIEGEDLAEISLELSTGILAQVHLDCLQRRYSRWCTVIAERGTLGWTFGNGVSWAGRGPAPAGADLRVELDPNDMYVDEIGHFLAIDDEPQRGAACDAAAGLRVLEICEAARRSADLGRAVAL
jgi:predicted dehydrogenase